MTFPMNGFDELDRNGKLTYLLGSYATMASHIEYFLEVILTYLLHSNQRHCGSLLRFISVPQQIESIKDISKEIHGKESTRHNRIVEAVGLAKGILRHRNHYLHSLHFLDDHNSASLSYRRGKFEADESKIDIEKMVDDLDRDSTHMLKILNLWKDKVVGYPEEEPPTLRERSALVQALRNHRRDHIEPDRSQPPEPSPEKN